MCIILNIGLVTNTNETLDLGLVIQTINSLLAQRPAWELTSLKLVDSDSEPTLVVTLEKTYLWNVNSLRVLHHSVKVLSDTLEQDCIALWDGYEAKGTLIGSNADKWGAFNAEYFFLQDGTRLGDLA